jgi:hypothetical protein
VRKKGRKAFFFEKKNQKTFATWRTLPERAATASQKSFASFLQKRRLFLRRPDLANTTAFALR